jgi:hypothetical protein
MLNRPEGMAEAGDTKPKLESETIQLAVKDQNGAEVQFKVGLTAIVWPASGASIFSFLISIGRHGYYAYSSPCLEFEGVLYHCHRWKWQQNLRKSWTHMRREKQLKPQLCDFYLRGSDWTPQQRQLM